MAASLSSSTARAASRCAHRIIAISVPGAWSHQSSQLRRFLTQHWLHLAAPGSTACQLSSFLLSSHPARPSPPLSSPPQLKLLDSSVTPACPAAKTSALIDSITACDDYCSRGAWSFASLDWSVSAGSDIFGWAAAMPLFSSKPQPAAWPTCPNHLFSEPPPCPGTNGTAENGKDGQDGQDGTSSNGGSGGSGTCLGMEGCWGVLLAGAICAATVVDVPVSARLALRRSSTSQPALLSFCRRQRRQRWHDRQC